MAKVYMHGDVVIKEIEKIPEGATKKADTIILEGEQTGHAHTIGESDIDKCDLYEHEEVLYLKVAEPIEIRHQQHKGTFTDLATGTEIKLPIGNYVIGRPFEYDHLVRETKEIQD